jgi:hypothetical protein
MRNLHLFAWRTISALGVMLVLGTSTAAAAPTAPTSPSVPSGLYVSAHLSGGQEVPPVSDTRGFGSALYKLSSDRTAIEYTLIAGNLTSTAVAAHIHGPAPAGKNAPVVAFLFPANPRSTCSRTASHTLVCRGRITAADLQGPLAGRPLSTLLTEMARGLTYTNVHTTRHPNGEIRGQNVPHPRANAGLIDGDADQIDALGLSY